MCVLKAYDEVHETSSDSVRSVGVRLLPED